ISIVHADAIHCRAPVYNMGGFVSLDDVVVWVNNEHIAINVQGCSVLGGDAMNVGIALHRDACAVFIHHSLIRATNGNRAFGANASRYSLDDEIRIIIWVVLEIVAFESVGGLASGIGAQHDEIVGPSIGLVGELTWGINFDGTHGVVRRPPGAHHQGD